MAIKAVVADDADISSPDNRIEPGNMNTLLNGDVLILPAGYLTGLTEDSDVVLLFAETEKDFQKRFPPSLRLQ